jgi:hypothetical protein
MKAITAQILVCKKYGDCSNNGISHRFDEILVACPDGPDEVDEKNPPYNFCKVVKRNLFGRYNVMVEPAQDVPQGHVGWMFGGAVIRSSDERFNKLLRQNPEDTAELIGPVDFHDRSEQFRR